MASLAALLLGLWGVFALHYQLGLPPLGRWILCGVWAALALFFMASAWRGPAARPAFAFGIATAVLLAWWSSIAPSNDRPWSDDVARQLRGEVHGTAVTLHNVRNFDWRSDNDYAVRWETRQYDLSRLRSVDTALSYWMGPAIAHTLVSFGFDDGRGGIDHLAFSIEIRKERGEGFSAIAGFFKKFELALVAADERDLIRVRTNVRGEDVFMYRVVMPPAAMHALFLAYLAEAAELKQAPRFYSTLTANCTTVVFEMVRHIVGGLPLDWRLLASGYLPEYLQKVGALTPGYDLETLRAAGRLTERAKAAQDDPQFSARIRSGMPGAEQESRP